ncbi:hypothetical protein NWI01_33300 [Nitrobacter winogradskyi]|uniref:Uncharacterized protein n=1 Tax=Nitrobacter winogradskyi TaxID=913 RepID=A0A4Y3WFY6_NITWI|nr:hypothetical protein NWI01_33300 [Nitrobacter winogradskyi]
MDGKGGNALDFPMARNQGSTERGSTDTCTTSAASPSKAVPDVDRLQRQIDLQTTLT